MAIEFERRQIDDFKARLAGGGARPNLFEVELSFPDWATKGFGAGGPVGAAAGGNTKLSEESRFMVKAAELPASNVGDIPVNFRGRILHVAGDRTFDPWTVTVINNTDWSLRALMENWSNGMNDREFDTAIGNPTDYQKTASVFQLSRSTKKGNQKPAKQMNIIAGYKFFGIRPSQVSSVALDYGSTDTIEEFQVTFQEERWTVDYGMGTNDTIKTNYGQENKG